MAETNSNEEGITRERYTIHVDPITTDYDHIDQIIPDDGTLTHEPPSEEQ